VIFLLVFVACIAWGIIGELDRADRRKAARARESGESGSYPVVQHRGYKVCPTCRQTFEVGFWPGQYDWNHLDQAFYAHLMSHSN